MSVKVITAPTVEPVSLVEAKLNLRVDTTDEDAAIAAMVTSAREELEHELQATIAQATLELTLDAFPADDLMLPRGPVAAISSVQYAHPTTGVMTALSASGYVLQSEETDDALRLAYGATWPATRQQPGAVVVTYTAGFAACPRSLRAWILLRVGTLYRFREADSDRAALPSPFVDRMVDRWRRCRL